MVVITVFIKFARKVLLPTIQVYFVLNLLHILELYYKHVILLSPLSHNTEYILILGFSNPSRPVVLKLFKGGHKCF